MGVHLISCFPIPCGTPLCMCVYVLRHRCAYYAIPGDIAVCRIERALSLLCCVAHPCTMSRSCVQACAMVCAVVLRYAAVCYCIGCIWRVTSLGFTRDPPMCVVCLSRCACVCVHASHDDVLCWNTGHGCLWLTRRCMCSWVYCEECGCMRVYECVRAWLEVYVCYRLVHHRTLISAVWVWW